MIMYYNMYYALYIDNYGTQMFVCANIRDVMDYSSSFSSSPSSAWKPSVSSSKKPIGDHLLFSYYSAAFLLLATILTSLSNTGREH